jgi:hypothetical protein
VDISGGGNDGHGCTGPSKEAHKISSRSVMGHVDPLSFEKKIFFYIFFLIFIVFQKFEFMNRY